MTESLEIIKTTEPEQHDLIQICDLWNQEYPEKISHNSLSEFENYLKHLTNLTHYLLKNDTNLILGWALTFEREQEKWFVIILSEKIKGQGWGRKMLNELKKDTPILNGWVIDHDNDRKKNGDSYLSPLKFYEKCNFETLHDIRLELDKISAVKIKWVNKNYEA